MATSPLALPWIFSLLTLFICRLIEAQLTYSDHCATFVPQAIPDLSSIASNTLPFYQNSQGYFTGDGALEDSSSSTFTFQTQAAQKTDREGVVKVDANLVFNLFDEYGDFTAVSFRLEGFWSASSGRLCMVGSSYVNGIRDDVVEEHTRLKAVLKLNNIHTSSSITNLITGTFESLTNNFNPISMLMFPQKNYTYSLLAPQETSNVSKIRLNLVRNRFCAILNPWYNFRLKYAEDCGSTKNCSPFQESNLLRSMVPYVIGCDCGSTQMRVLLIFSNQSSSIQKRDYASFEPKKGMIGEGLWDDKENVLRFDACRISVTEGLSLSDARVQDCSISFNFRFPTVWSIKERNSVVVEIYSKKSPNESGYFGKITAWRTSGYQPDGFDKKYEYTQINRVRELCPKKNQSRSISTYPNRDSNDLSFQMSVETQLGKKIGHGHSSLLFVGDQFYQQQYRPAKNNYNDAPIIEGKPSNTSKLRMSYTITIWRSGNEKCSSGSTIFNGSHLSLVNGMVISAEGIYDESIGSLCMIGCRSLFDSMDCEILIKIQFPPLDFVKKVWDSIKGSIKSLRRRSDPLYFGRLKVSTMSLYERSVDASPSYNEKSNN